MFSDERDDRSDEIEVPSNESDIFSDFERTSDDEYDPCGTESDEESNGCCHWSTKREIPPYQINTDADLDEFGRYPVVFEDDLKPHNIVELIINDRFLDL